MTNSLPIGVFDSGVGGLSVANVIRRKLPHEDILYLGDTARVPYGNRGPKTIRRYSLNAARLLVSRGIKAIVIACNTASSYGLEAVANEFASVGIPVLGVIEPVATHTLEAIHDTHPDETSPMIAVLATRATIKSGVYDATLKMRLPTVSVVQQACPLLVPLAEEGLHHGSIPEAIVREYLLELKEKLPDQDRRLSAMILGCTHYPLLRDVIESCATELFGDQLQVFDSASSTAEQLRQLLTEKEILNPASISTSSASPSGRLQLLSTDSPEAFTEVAERIFGESFPEVHHVDIIDNG